MKSKFYYTFPAIRGIQARREYFVVMCPLNIISKMFIFNELEEISPEYRAQRTVNMNRIPEIAEYIVNNPDNYVFSSLTASVDGEYKFTPLMNDESNDVGKLQISMDSKLLINDGQHRRLAIEEALKIQPSIEEETISVVLYSDEGLKRSQQMFSDLNKHAVNVSKSIGILYDSRDKISMVTKELLEQIPYLKNYSDLERSSLSKFSNKLFTLSNIYKSNERIIYKNTINEEMKKFIIDYWIILIQNMSEWKMVFQKQISPYCLRQSSISSYGVILEAFGIIGNYIYENDKENISKYLSKLDKIDWNRSNLKDWNIRVISSSGRISKNNTCIKLTNNLIKEKIGIPLNLDEKKIEQKFRRD